MPQLTLTLPPETAARIAEEAAARGVTPEAVATEAIETWIAADDLGWDEGPEPESENIPVDDAFDALEARIAAARAAAGK